MPDRILDSFVSDFAAQYGLEKLAPPALFGCFVNHCVISRQVSGSFSLEDVNVDGGQDTGLDAIAVIVNSRLVTAKEDIDFFLENVGRLDVEFVFIQSKRSARFEGSEMGSFFFCAKNFFSNAPSVQTNPAIAAYREIKEYIYDKSINMDEAPVCRLFYATTGQWCDNDFLTGLVNSNVRELESSRLFSSVKFQALDADRLKALYRELRQRVVKEITFDRHTILPKIDRVTQAYLGILPCKDFLRLITDDDGQIQRGLFYDNVRDYQGDTPVNLEITSTLSDPSSADKFVLLNNGITIVAKSVTQVGATFKLSEFQVVNGCQTSHVLHRNRATLTDQVCLPIKLIVTDDAEVSNLVIKATNRQTEVKVEAFESLSPFHRKLEEYFASFGSDGGKRLYYERRSKQYANTEVKPTQVISLATQAKAFLAMFLNEPHSTHRYYGEILNSNRGRLFLEDHSPFPYYVSAYALVAVDAHIKAGNLPAWSREFRYHIMLLFRIEVAASLYPPLKANAAQEYCDRICRLLWRGDDALSAFRRATETLGEKRGTFQGDQHLAARLKSFTTHLLQDVAKGQRPPAEFAESDHVGKVAGVAQRHVGVVKRWELDRCFGFIHMSDGREPFAYYREIKGTIHQYLRVGERVEFTLTSTEKGLQARDIKLLPRAG